MKVKNLSSFKLDDVLLCFYCMGYTVLSLLPAVKYSVSYVIAGSFCLVPVVLSFLKFPKLRTDIFIIAVLGIVCGLLTWLLDNGGIKETVNTAINFLRFFMPCLLLYSISKASTVSKWIVWIFAAIIMIYISYKTVSAIDTDDMIARLLANGGVDEELTEYRMDNIGGFGFCYAVGLTFPLWVSTLIDTKTRWVKIFAAVLIIITFIFVLKVQYMILLIMCIFTVMLAIMYRPGNAGKKLLGFIVLLAIIFLLPLVLRAITHLNIGTHISGKINNVASFLDGSVAAENTTSRVVKYKAAFSEFIRSPIFGAVGSKAAIKAHSTWLVLGCKMGLIGISSFAYMLFSGYKWTSFTLKNFGVSRIPFVVTFVTLIVLALVNPVDYSYEISFVVFLFVPLTMLLFGEKKEGKEDAELGA